ncbi:hypothetical protein ABZ615_04425 [Streptomyces sp. NPDC007325]
MNGEDRPTEEVSERWKMKGVAWRVLFYVLGAYAFLNVVGFLSAHAQE